jgi:hypothetical protein
MGWGCNLERGKADKQIRWRGLGFCRPASEIARSYCAISGEDIESEVADRQKECSGYEKKMRAHISLCRY